MDFDVVILTDHRYVAPKRSNPYNENVLLVSHADIVMHLIANKSNQMMVKPYECSWFATANWFKKNQSDSLCRYVRYHANKAQNAEPRMEILLQSQ